MDLPETNILNFFNTVLISVSELTIDGGSCEVDSLIKQCKSIVFGGQRGEYESVIEHCSFCGLLKIKNSTATLTTLGQKFLDANKERYFEMNEAQKVLLAERIVFRGAWNNYARELFGNFYLNQASTIYELSVVDSSLSKNQMTTVHFFKYLGILHQNQFLIQVDKKYCELVYQLTADSKTLTEQQLEKILMENRKLGAQAENAVVEFERKRLSRLGKTTQAELVRRISTLNVSAGYDIESFDGTTDEIFPNRFIEVKASQGDQLRFYWSNNEMQVAKRKKESYWIYMMKGFKEDKPQDSIPIMIRNPEYSIPRQSYLTMEAHTFLIKEIANVALIDYSLLDLCWYQLKLDEPQTNDGGTN